jgi:hypothetical protein
MKFILLAFSITFMPLLTFSQSEESTNYSDQDIINFVEINKAIMLIQKGGEDLMMKAKEKNEMDMESFNKIYQSKQNPEIENESSKEDQESFEAIMTEFVQIQQGLQIQMSDAITSRGMEIEKFERMMNSYQESAELQQKVNELLMKE